MNYKNTFLIFLIFVLFVGCSNTEDASDTKIEQYSDENGTVINITSSGKSVINIDGNSTVNFTVLNLKTDSQISAESLNDKLSVSVPICSIDEIKQSASCSTTVKAISKGIDVARLSVSGSYPSYKDLNYSIVDRNDSIIVTSLKNVSLKVGGTSTVSFAIANAVSSSNPVLTSTNKNIIIGTPVCKTSATDLSIKNCSVSISGTSDGNDTLTIGIEDLNITIASISFIVEKQNPTLTLSSAKNVSLNSGATSTVYFTVANIDNNMSILSKTKSNTTKVATITTPSCTQSSISETAKNCTATITAKGGGSEIATVYISGFATATADINISVTELNSTLTITSAKTVNIYEDANSTITFTIGNYKTDTNISATALNDSVALISNPTCLSSGTTTKSCSVVAKALTDGNTTISISVSNSTANLIASVSLFVKALETNTTDIDTNETNQTEINSTIKFSKYQFGTAQLNKIESIEGDKISIITMLINPISSNEIIDVVSQNDGYVSIGSTIKDTLLSDANKTVFKTSISIIKSGTEKIIFRVKDRDLTPLYLDLIISPYLCGSNENSWNYISAGENRDEIVLGSKFGYTSVGLIYPQLSNYGEMERQNFTYVYIGDNNKTVHSDLSNGSFAFFKIASGLKNKNYLIKFRTLNDSTLRCLSGTFPKYIESLTDDQIQESLITSEPPSPQ